LETALLTEPDNTRYVFYLAQAYRDAGDYELATRHYRRRTEMGGSKEEIWVSLYMIARTHEFINHPRAVLVEEYLKAFQFDPLRAEPLYRIGALFRRGCFSRTGCRYATRRSLPCSSKRMSISIGSYWNTSRPAATRASIPRRSPPATD
jgi:hypothetical protein